MVLAQTPRKGCLSSILLQIDFIWNKKNEKNTIDQHASCSKKQQALAELVEDALVDTSDVAHIGLPDEIVTEPAYSQAEMIELMTNQQYQNSDDGNARLFHELYGKNFAHCQAVGFLQWTGTHWTEDYAEQTLNLAIRDFINDRLAYAAVKHKQLTEEIGQLRQMLGKAGKNRTAKEDKAGITQHDQETMPTAVLPNAEDTTGELVGAQPAGEQSTVENTASDEQATPNDIVNQIAQLDKQRTFCKSIMDKLNNSTARKNAIRNQLLDHIHAKIEEFDLYPSYLNCQNGVIDLTTGDLQPHVRHYKFTYCCPAVYSPNADQTAWHTFLCNSIEHYADSEEFRHWFQMACGYSITGNTNEECLFYVQGPTRSGKGTFTTAIQAVLGDKLTAEPSFETFTKRRDGGNDQGFDLAGLRASRFICASEGKKGTKMNEAVIKRVTGGDTIRCSFKGKDHFEYRPEYKIWLFSNHPVMGDVMDDAFWGRVRLIRFPWSNLGKEDKSLKPKMKSGEMQTAVLSWLVQGAVMWAKSPNGLTTPDCVEQSLAAERLSQDIVQQWINECIKLGIVDKAVTEKELYSSYTQWCLESGHNAMSKTNMRKTLLEKKWTRVRRNTGQCFLHIELRSDI